MSQIDDRTRLLHMVAAARRALELAQSTSREGLERDDVVALALVRLLEIIGEAARGMSAALRERHPEVPWREIVGTRNRVIPAYFSVDLDIVWQIARVEHILARVQS